jgi:predicted MFS family arabinose efflux permease
MHEGVWRLFRTSSVAVKVILLGTFINRIGGFLHLFLVLFLTSLGYSSEQATLALGCYGGGTVVGLLLGGALAERLGARNATVLGTAGTAVLTASLLYLPTYGLLLGAAALTGLLTQIYRPASATLLSDLTPADQQVMIFAMYRFALNLGTTAAPLIGFALYRLDGQSYTLLFWIEAAVALAYTGMALATIPGRSAAPAPPADEGGSAGGYLGVLADRRFLVFLVAMLLNSVVYVQFLSALPLDIQSAGLSLFWYTLAISLNGLLVITAELPLTKFSQRLPFRLTIVLCFGLIGLGNALYGLPLVPLVIVLGTLVWTTGEMIGGPSAFAYPAVAGPPRLKGYYIGSFQFVYGLGSAVGSALGGVLYARLGHSIWSVVAVVSLVATLLAVVGVRTGARPGGQAQEQAPDVEIQPLPGSAEPRPT